jgi:S-formylglutathione hydrolase
MKKLFVFIVLIPCLLACDPEVDEPTPSRLYQLRIEVDALSNSVAGTETERNIQIYLPEGYADSSEEYPVIYLLHGGPGTDSFYVYPELLEKYNEKTHSFAALPTFPEEGFKTWIDTLVARGKLRPSIIVMPDANSAPPLETSWYSNSATNGNFEDYICEDLINYMDTHYRTINSRNGRAIIGYCCGGYGALMIAMKHPELFCTVASHSAPLYVGQILYKIPDFLAENPNCNVTEDLWEKPMTSFMWTMAAAWSPNPDNPPLYADFPFDCPTGEVDQTIMAKWMANDPFTLLDNYGQGLKTLSGVYIDIGENDEFQFQLAYPLVFEKLDELGINYDFEMHDGMHYNQMFECLEKSLTYCSDRM